MLREMEEDGSTPDTAAFQQALDACRDASQWEKAMELITEMDELGVRQMLRHDMTAQDRTLHATGTRRGKGGERKMLWRFGGGERTRGRTRGEDVPVAD